MTNPIIDFTDAMHRAEIAKHERALWKYRHRNQVRLLTLMLAGVALLLVVYLIQR